MSNIQNIRILEDAQADFDTALSQRNWKDCHAIIDSLYEQGFEKEGMLLSKRMNAAMSEGDVRDVLVAKYGEEKVEWAEEHVNSADHRDYMDRHYP